MLKKIIIIGIVIIIPLLLFAQEEKYEYVKEDLLLEVKDSVFEMPLEVYAAYISFANCSNKIIIDSLIYLEFEHSSRAIKNEITIPFKEFSKKHPHIVDKINFDFSEKTLAIFKKYKVFFIKRKSKAFSPTDTIPRYITTQHGENILHKDLNHNCYLLIKLYQKSNLLEAKKELKMNSDIKDVRLNTYFKFFSTKAEPNDPAYQNWEQCYKTVQFEKVTDKHDFPPVFKKLDNLLVEFYKWSEYDNPEAKGWLEREMPQDMFMSFAKTLVWRNYMSDSLERKYLSLANEPTQDQYRREMQFKELGEEFNEIKLPLVGGVLKNIERKLILTKLPWEWTFHLANKYILIVEPIKAETLPSNPENTRFAKMVAFYQSRIIDDIKGNYKGPDPALLAASFVKGHMNVGNKYLVLISMRNSFEKYYGEHYLIRGNATNKEAIFPIIDGNIVDNNNILKTGMTEIPVNEYKYIIRDFIHKTAEVPYGF